MSAAWGVALLCLFAAVAQATNSLGFLDQSFYFSYSPASQAVPVPVTTQCGTIHITWERGAGVGANPVAPYYLQIYTSAFVFPFIVSAGSGLSFDWEVPFGPGTLYQICMFDSNGNSGGCEGVYTVIANTTTPACQNATFPLGPLDVEGVVNTGPLSQYGWIQECSDIQVTPKNGTPPYTFTVAPALHPPHNMTGSDQSPMNWTVNLSWGSVFFISVVDANMNFWAYGPLHSGQGSGDLACLSGSSESHSKDISPTTAAASGIGGLLLGALIGAAATFLFFSRWRMQARTRPLLDPAGSYGLEATPYALYSPSHSSYQAIPLGHPKEPSSASLLSPFPGDMALRRESSGYQIEPFTPTVDRARQPSGGSEGAGGNNVYVVHQDGGRPPVTVYHQDGTSVVELPPRYAPDSSTSDRDDPSERPDSGIIAERRGSSGASQSIEELIVPRRRPNRPGKP